MNNVPKTTSTLLKAPMLSTDRVREGLAGGVFWVDPRGDRHFLGHLRKPFFLAPDDI